MVISILNRSTAESRSEVEESTTTPTKLEPTMPADTSVYSTLFHCLYDERAPRTRRFPHYSVLRAIDSRDVRQQQTQRPRVHDFAVIWDDDHDTRIIPVLEEMLMAGVLPGVQFIGEHKGLLTVILASATYYTIDIKAFVEKVTKLTEAAGDCWQVDVGMFDHHPGNLALLHQCDFREIIGGQDADRAFLFTIDAMWSLGTKEWRSIDDQPISLPPGQFFPNLDRERYHLDRPARTSTVPPWL